MTNLTVSISDDRFLKLKEVAGQLRVTPEELVAARVLRSCRLGRNCRRVKPV